MIVRTVSLIGLRDSENGVSDRIENATFLWEYGGVRDCCRRSTRDPHRRPERGESTDFSVRRLFYRPLSEPLVHLDASRDLQQYKESDSFSEL